MVSWLFSPVEEIRHQIEKTTCPEIAEQRRYAPGRLWRRLKIARQPAPNDAEVAGRRCLYEHPRPCPTSRTAVVAGPSNQQGHVFDPDVADQAVLSGQKVACLC